MSKLDWSGICATSTGRYQCCEENCILYPICLIKDASRLSSDKIKPRPRIKHSKSYIKAKEALKRLRQRN